MIDQAQLDKLMDQMEESHGKIRDALIAAKVKPSGSACAAMMMMAFASMKDAGVTEVVARSLVDLLIKAVFATDGVVTEETGAFQP